MYFPYLRGRQYELIALRELVRQDLLSEEILPVIEPVKLSSTLLSTMEEFVNKGKKLAIVCNPAVGSFNAQLKTEETGIGRQRFWELLDQSFIVKSHIMKANSKTVLETWKKEKNVQETDWLVICNTHDYVDAYLQIFGNMKSKYVLIPDKFRRRIRKNRVLFEDRFMKCDRNSDYLKSPDEFFSEDHLFYEDEGYVGFGDYSIIGNEYMESGFAPYAVAIHIVYFDQDKNLRIHHFVSESNDDIQNPAKKFYEALSKLKEGMKTYNIQETKGVSDFLQCLENGTYPGLGSVKKLSLMHHLELMGNYLNGVK